MNEVLSTVLIALGTSLATGFGSWVFFIRKHKADADGAEKTNDRTEIENLKLIVDEWRQSAKTWKEMADEYQQRYVGNARKLETLEDQVGTLTRELRRAQERIEHLEKENEKLNRTSADGNK